MVEIDTYNRLALDFLAREWGVVPDYIQGDARFALITVCGHCRVRMFPTKAIAASELLAIGKGNGCSLLCQNQHFVLDVERQVPVL